MKRALLAVVLVASCKSREVPPEPSQKAPPVKVEKAAPKAKPVIGTSLTIVPCNLPGDPRKGSNSVGATRHLHRGPRNELYFFPDFRAPTLLEPIADGCGYRSAGSMPEKEGHDFALQPDGAIVLVPRSDESKKTACRTRAFSSLRYGEGALSNGIYYYRSTGALMRMKLDDEQCAPEEVTTLKELPADGLTKVRVGQAAGDLLLAIPRQDWKWSSELFRFDPNGKFLRKYGAAEGKGELQGDKLTGCGDGLCGANVMSEIDVYDREGMRVGGASLRTLTKLNRIHVGGIVDVPEKGVYVLIGHHPDPKGDGHAEVIRLDGVY